MSILLGHRIEKEIKSGGIFAEPFVKENLSINSVDVTLSNKLVTYVKLEIYKDMSGNYCLELDHSSKGYLKDRCLDMKRENETFELTIPEEGLVLTPGILYLGSTNEKIGSDKFVPMYEGRSSMARLGIYSHISAGFGDLGFKSNWTLEINVVHPIKIYPNIRIGQVFFHEVDLPEDMSILQKYKGKYDKQVGPQSSKAYLDFKNVKQD
jgi:dCTP deaminase